MSNSPFTFSYANNYSHNSECSLNLNEDQKSLEYILVSIERKAIFEGDDKGMSSKFSDSSLYINPAPTIGFGAVAFFREYLNQIREKYRPTTTDNVSFPRLPSLDNIPIYFFPPDAKKYVSSNNKCNVALYLS